MLIVTRAERLRRDLEIIAAYAAAYREDDWSPVAPHSQTAEQAYGNRAAAYRLATRPDHPESVLLASRLRGAGLS